MVDQVSGPRQGLDPGGRILKSDVLECKGRWHDVSMVQYTCVYGSCVADDKMQSCLRCPHLQLPACMP